MVSFLRSWILNIVTVIIFITFLELLLPSSSTKKYIKMVVGILVMIVIINPVLGLVDGKITLQEEIFKASTAIDKKTLSFNIDRFEGTQNAQMIALYKRKVEKYIKDQIEYNNNINVISIDSEIDKDRESEEFGNIKYLDIVVSNDLGDKDSNKEIKPVMIDVRVNRQKLEKEEAVRDKDQHMVEEIKKDIADSYGLGVDKIHIDIYK